MDQELKIVVERGVDRLQLLGQHSYVVYSFMKMIMGYYEKRTLPGREWVYKSGMAV